MPIKRLFSILLLICGMTIFVFGRHEASEAMQNKEKIVNAEENQNGHRRPALGPVRRNVRTAETEQAQQKIDHEQQIVAVSQVSASWLQGSGIVLFIVGLIALSTCIRRK